MGEIDIKALEANFAKWRADRGPSLKDSEAFEIYSIEQILKDADLSDEEMRAGHFGGGDDGGVDGMFFSSIGFLYLMKPRFPILR
jgi:hypothetical protein